MADRSHSTPSNSCRNDRDLADAYRSLEDDVAKLRDMAMLMEMAAESSLIHRVGGTAEDLARLAIRGSNMRVLILSEDQANGLEYALDHMGTLVRCLHHAYYAGYKSERSQIAV